MNRLKLYPLLFAAILLGCADANHQTSDSPPATVKPIDRVRAGIESLAIDLQVTLDSAEQLAKDDSADIRSRRAAFSKDLNTTEHDMTTLRTDAADLKERASEYMMMWGGQVAIVSDNSVAYRPNEQRDVTHEKYDQMVDSLVAARDILNPLLAHLKGFEASPDLSGIRANIAQVQSDGNRAISHLNDAVARLDELKAQIKANPSAGRSE